MPKEINIKIEGDSLTRDQVNRLVSELNETMEDGDKITIADFPPLIPRFIFVFLYIVLAGYLAAPLAGLIVN